ncbi:alpha/beta fold hydrolase [Streptomyces nigrescens]|uniref:alpha/beta fold hydrolase n=1 Tax=Streptomyces nigrescens TaxID=1920 RepID=UPI002252EB63|nr:alpha/beta fold hydrolase [Streptomyces libani]MCX5444863.1 alpha/beta fold hydrolase [Streptomyces libani]
MTQIPAATNAAAALPPLSTTVAGDPTGPGILLAHGATGSIQGNYGDLIPALVASGHRVVAPDYPGSGKTPRATGPLELDALADALVAEALAAGLETFTLIGYSMGTAVSVRAATRHPERVRGLVLTAGLAAADARTTVWLDLYLHLLERADYTGFARARALSGFAPTTSTPCPPRNGPPHWTRTRPSHRAAPPNRRHSYGPWTLLPIFPASRCPPWSSPPLWTHWCTRPTRAIWQTTSPAPYTPR